MLLDTSGIFTYFDTENAQNETAVRLMLQRPVKLTHSYVLSEFVTLAQARGLRRHDATAFVRDLLEHPEVDIIWVTEELHLQAMELLDSRPDKGYSLCDAVSFVLMRQYELNDALTTDHHFTQEGFQRLLGG